MGLSLPLCEISDSRNLQYPRAGSFKKDGQHHGNAYAGLPGNETQKNTRACTEAHSYVTFCCIATVCSKINMSVSKASEVARTVNTMIALGSLDQQALLEVRRLLHTF